MEILFRAAVAGKCLLLLSLVNIVCSLLGPPCSSPLGLEFGLLEHSLTFDMGASSGEPDTIRLNGPKAWRPVNISGSFVEINISQPVLLSALQMQGDPRLTGQISSWFLDTSFDCETYRTERYSLDVVSPVHTQTIYLKSPEFVSCIRLRPTNFKGKAPALRLELLGCVVQDTSTCGRDIHPVSEIWMDNGGRQVNFGHEVVLSWVKLLLDMHAHGDSGDAGIFYSRSCDHWDYYEPTDTSVISVTSSDEKSSWMTIEMDKPVRAKCVRIFPPLATTLREVHTSGCNSHKISSIYELKMRTKMKAEGEELLKQDIAAYQEDAPIVPQESVATSEDVKYDTNKMSATHENEKSLPSSIDATKHIDKYLPKQAGLVKYEDFAGVEDSELKIRTSAETFSSSSSSTVPTSETIKTTEPTTTAETTTTTEPTTTTKTTTTAKTTTTEHTTTADTTTTAETATTAETTTTTETKSMKESTTNSLTLWEILFHGGSNGIQQGSNSTMLHTDNAVSHSTAENLLINQVNSDGQNKSPETTTITDVVTNKQQDTTITDVITNKQQDTTITDIVTNKQQDTMTDVIANKKMSTTTTNVTSNVQRVTTTDFVTKNPQTVEENNTDNRVYVTDTAHVTETNNVLRDRSSQSSTPQTGNYKLSDNTESAGVVDKAAGGTSGMHHSEQQPISTLSTQGLDLGTSAESGSQDKNHSKCGVKNWTKGSRKKRVISGHVNEPGEWPWLVSMHFLPECEFTRNSGFKHLCGGSLIAPNWILTAAHCFRDEIQQGLSNLTSWRLYFGIYDLAREDNQDFIQERLIEAVYMYPEYNVSSTPLIYDLALVKLNEPVTFSERVSPVCMDDTDIYYQEKQCFVTGWGQLTTTSPGSRFPYTAALSTLTLPQCKNKYDILPEDHPVKSYVRIESPVLCATVGSSGEDACQGDSGGPLMCEQDGRWYQAGIVSAGYLCGHEATPGLYTRVSYYKDWIREMMELNNDL